MKIELENGVCIEGRYDKVKEILDKVYGKAEPKTVVSKPVTVRSHKRKRNKKVRKTKPSGTSVRMAWIQKRIKAYVAQGMKFRTAQKNAFVDWRRRK